MRILAACIGILGTLVLLAPVQAELSAAGALI